MEGVHLMAKRTQDGRDSWDDRNSGEGGEENEACGTGDMRMARLRPSFVDEIPEVGQDV